MGGINHVVRKHTVHSNSIDFVKETCFSARHVIFGVNAADFMVARWGGHREVEHKRYLSRRVQSAL
jgi:hypothetical protein